MEPTLDQKRHLFLRQILLPIRKNLKSPMMKFLQAVTTIAPSRGVLRSIQTIIQFGRLESVLMMVNRPREGLIIQLSRNAVAWHTADRHLGSVLVQRWMTPRIRQTKMDRLLGRCGIPITTHFGQWVNAQTLCHLRMGGRPTAAN